MKLLILSLLLITSSCSHHGHKHEHKHQHDASRPKQALTLDNGQKWKTDAVLRTGMDNIHTGLVHLLNKEAPGKASEKDYLAFYDVVQKNTETIIEKCKMSPKMDEAYHVILEEMLDASEKLKVPAERKTVSKRFINAFHQYQDHFDQDFAHD